MVSAFDQFRVDVFLKHHASAQLFVFGLALYHKCVKKSIRVYALLLATFLVGNEVGRVRVVVPIIPVVSAFFAALSEEEDRGGPSGGLVLFEFVDTNRGSLGGERSAAKLTLLPIPSLEVEEVWLGNPVART